MKTESSTTDALLRPIMHLWREDRPIVLIARNSGENGAEARRQAVNDLLEATDRLARAGCDVRSVLPTKEALLEMIRCAVPLRSKDKSGKSFSNRIVTVDLRCTHGVYVVVSVGTGRKLDENGIQPFVQYLAELVTQIRPCLLFARRLDRMSRRAWALGPVMLNLTELTAFIGDSDFGLSAADGIESVLVFFRAQASEEEARKMPLKCREGMARETGPSMATGSCAYAVAAPVPPGFMSYRSTVRGMIGRRFITFDTPACRPTAATVAAGLPEIFEDDADGTRVPVDQVENIRWALERLGQPNWTVPSIAKGLAARSFSTEGFRRTHGPVAFYTMALASSDASKVLHSIKRNLDLYETGVMTLELGVGGVNPVVITDCFPPDGRRWASADDFARIRRWLTTTMPPARRSSVLSGFPVTVNGTECVLIKSGGLSGKRFLSAVVAASYRTDGRQVSPGVPIVLKPEMIIEPFVEMIANLGDTALALVPFETDADGLLKLELDTARTRLRVLEDEKAAIEAQLLARSDSGLTLQVTGALLTKFNDRYNSLTDVEQPKAQLHIKTLEEQISAQQKRFVRERAGVAADRLLTLIAALRDTEDTTCRELLRQTIRNVTITVDRHTAHRRLWWNYTIAYTMHIDAGEGAIEIPVTHTAEHGKSFDPEALARTGLTLMCNEEITWEHARPVTDAVLRPNLGKIVGIPGRKLILPNICDPRLAHLTALVLTHDSNDIASIAISTGETETLLRRIRTINRNATRAVWQTRPRASIATWYQLAAQGPVTQEIFEAHGVTKWSSARNMLYLSADWHHWTSNDHAYELAPCPTCRSRRRSPALIPEPTGLICLDCETDEAGEHWPIKTYGQYLVSSSKDDPEVQ